MDFFESFRNVLWKQVISYLSIVKKNKDNSIFLFFFMKVNINNLLSMLKIYIYVIVLKDKVVLVTELVDVFALEARFWGFKSLLGQFGAKTNVR